MGNIEREGFCVQSTLTLCRQNNSAAWSRIWTIINSVSTSTIIQILRRRGFDSSLTMDVIQELCIYLLEDDMRRLSRFRGQSYAEFESYIRTIAKRFALRRIDRWVRRQPPLSTICKLSSIVDRNGASEFEVLSKLEEFTESLSPKDRDRLHALCCLDDDANPPRRCSARTLRRWKRELKKCCISI